MLLVLVTEAPGLQSEWPHHEAGPPYLEHET